MNTLTMKKIMRIGMIFIMVAFLTIILLFLLKQHGSIGILIPISIFMIFFCGIIVFMLRKLNREINIITTGSKAQLVIKEVKDIVNIVGKKHNRIKVTLLATIHSEKSTYDMEHTLYFSSRDTKYMVPGAIIPVTIDQNDPSKIIVMDLEWFKQRETKSNI